MKVYKFTAVFIPEKDKNFPNVYTVEVPALPGCLSCGDSLLEARYNIREAIELYLECQIEDDRPVPEDKKTRLPKGAHAEEITVGIEFKVQAGFERKMSLAYAR